MRDFTRGFWEGVSAAIEIPAALFCIFLMVAMLITSGIIWTLEKFYKFCLSTMDKIANHYRNK